MTGYAGRFGWRLRIGMILPSVNVVAEGEVAAMLPDGVSLHTTRLRLTGGSPEELMRMADSVEQGVELLADANVDIIVFHCTGVTTYDAPLAKRIKDRIEASSGKPGITTAEAIVAAGRALGVKRLSMATPYQAAINEREVAFLAEHGIEVLRELGLGLGSGEAFAAVEPGQWYRHARSLRDDAADAYFLSCTAIRTAGVISTLERDLGKPVITSNQTMVWHALRSCGIAEPVTGFGTLLSEY